MRISTTQEPCRFFLGRAFLGRSTSPEHRPIWPILCSKIRLVFKRTIVGMSTNRSDAAGTPVFARCTMGRTSGRLPKDLRAYDTEISSKSRHALQLHFM